MIQMFFVAVLTVTVPSVSLAQDYGDYDEYLESGEVDEYGLPLRTRTQHERERNASSQPTGWGATERSETNSSAVWGATPRSEPGVTSGWGGQIVDRRQNDPSKTSCAISGDQIELALRQADIALASGDLDNWFDAILPLARAGCDRPELYQRIEQAMQAEAARIRSRDQQIAEATRGSRSRLRQRGEPHTPSSLSMDWIAVANGLANLGATIRATREGRPIPPTTTIISQNSDGSIAYELPPTPAPPTTNPAATAELDRRITERRQMEAEAVRATNISSWYAILQDPNAGISTRGGPSEPGESNRGTSSTGTYHPAPLLRGGSAGTYNMEPAADSACNASFRFQGARCMCQAGTLMGVPNCNWVGNNPGQGVCEGVYQSYDLVSELARKYGNAPRWSDQDSRRQDAARNRMSECTEYVNAEAATRCAPGDYSCADHVRSALMGNRP